MAETKKQSNTDFFNIVSSLSPEVSFYLSSDVLSDFIKEINTKYDFEPGYLAKKITGLVINHFNFSKLEKELKEELSDKNYDYNNLMVDILGIIFLPIDDYIKNISIKQEIKKYQGDEEKFKKYKDEFQSVLADEYYDILELWLDRFEEKVDIKKEKEYALNLFDNNLVYLLKKGDFSINQLLVYLLFSVDGFSKELSSVILKNQEILTSAEFSLNHKKVKPKIETWLKDFIRINGSDFFNNIVLSKYISDSPNGKKLNIEERKILIKLLNLYRNVKFFPKTLEGLPPSKWMIMPFYESDNINTSGKNINKSSTHKPLATPETKEETEIKNLQKMAEQYELGTLERRAIEEEIRKVKLNIKYQKIKK